MRRRLFFLLLVGLLARGGLARAAGTEDVWEAERRPNVLVIALWQELRAGRLGSRGGKPAGLACVNQICGEHQQHSGAEHLRRRTNVVHGSSCGRAGS